MKLGKHLPVMSIGWRVYVTIDFIDDDVRFR